MSKPLLNYTLNGPRHVRSLGTINLIIGKNGCGKSSLLKEIDRGPAAFGENIIFRYITPERGGVLKYDPNVDVNLTNNPNWDKSTRRNNQFAQFKNQTMVFYRRLELLVLREIEKNRASEEDFEATIASINELLDNVKIVRESSDFSIVSKSTGSKVESSNISSGESELIGLAIECITFAWECKSAVLGWLLLDEPDVHLHPDLQTRLAKLLTKLINGGNMRAIIATHSTAMLAAFSEDPNARVCFINKTTGHMEFRATSDSMRSILPVFGAHPLSAVFNRQKLLILEGDDDVRIWQRANRSSRGKINVYPVETDGIAALNAAETEAAAILDSIYDEAKAYSLRDRDDDPPSDLEPIGAVSRFRLRCRTAENLFLSDESLTVLNTTWDQVILGIDEWLKNQPTHPHHAEMTAFKAAGFQRKDHPLKGIRNDLLGIIGTSKSWEDVIGIAISRLNKVATPSVDSLQTYLGEGVCSALIP